MHTYFLLGTIASLILLVSCDNPKAPQVVYDDTISDTLTMDNVLDDTTKVLVAGMPVYLDSTEVLIHPIGWVNIYSSSYKNRYSIDVSETISSGDIRKAKSKKESSYSYDVHTDSKSYLSGEMVNLIFEDLRTGEQRKLTEQVMIIQYAKYLKDVAKEINKHYMLYSTHDKDYNRDGVLNYKDLQAYYLSNLDGSNFTKITEDYHYFDTSELMLKNMKFYFRTLEDVDKDGKYNKKDKYHYYYINLLKGDFTPIEYFPLELLNIN